MLNIYRMMIFMIAVFIFQPASAQPDIRWTKAFGGESDDVGYSVQQTSDGGFIVTGYTGASGENGREVWLVKTDADGNMEWSRTFGGKGDDQGNSVQQTRDGGFIITGMTQSTDSGLFSDLWLVKTDADGNLEWSRAFGGKHADGLYSEIGRSVEQTVDGGFVIGGSTNSYGSGAWDMWCVKTNGGGVEEWSRTFGGPNNDDCRSIRQTRDAGFILTGWTGSSGTGFSDVCLVKTDENGNEQWNRTLGGKMNIEEGWSVRQIRDGGFIIAGYSGFGGGDILLMKTDPDGNETWRKNYGGSSYDVGRSVLQTSDDGFIITGDRVDEIGLLKTDADGEQEWSVTLCGGSGYSVRQTRENGFIVTGYTKSAGGDKDVCLIRTAPESSGVEEDGSSAGPADCRLSQNYPNPFNSGTRIDYRVKEPCDVLLKLYDLQGREIQTIVDARQNTGSYSQGMDLTDLSSGVYLCRIQMGGFRDIKKIVKTE